MRTLLIASLFLVHGCTLQVYVKGAVDSYCGLDEAQRAANRAVVAAAVAPHRILIECADDH